MSRTRFDPGPVLSRLKDFQRRTVDYIFQRLYLDDPPALRFLVADEVGLGKTMVARGVIARALEHLHDHTGRIDIVYVCSNAAIAAQNVNRLNVLGRQEFALASRLTLLPSHVSGLAQNAINFISFTPGTTFDLKSRGGQMRERAILYRMLRDEPWLDRRGLRNLLKCTAGRRVWRNCAESWEIPIDQELAESFRKSIRSADGIRERLVIHTERFHRYRERIPRADSQARYELVGDLRQCLARTCLDALEPDLVILDEFQRFRDLLDGTDEAADLAKALFAYPGVRVLLLSATPYKMLALDHEREDDHYPEFLRTLGFLLGNDQEVQTLAGEIQTFRQALYANTAGTVGQLPTVRSRLEAQLRRVMCRTERVGMTRQRDAMLSEILCPAPLRPEDLEQAAMTDRAARAVRAQDIIEYWKSSPYLLNFLKNYEIRRKMDELADSPPDTLLSELQRSQPHLLRRERLERYETIEPGNPRMRALFGETLDRGLWRVLWLPPSLPYSEPEGAFATVGDVTKRLVFSCWNAVPDAIAALCSYEAERRMLEGLSRDLQHSTLYDHLKPLLRFTHGRDGRLTGMPTLALLYPSPALAQLIDPLQLALAHGGGQPVSRDRLLAAAEEAISSRLGDYLQVATGDASVDQRWYWAAPALLDAQLFPSVRDWLTGSDAWAEAGPGHDDNPGSGFRDHLAHFVDAFDSRLNPPLGRPPADLARVLAELALAGPGVCALRALGRIAPDLADADPALLSSAAKVAGGFRTLFNLPESIALLRGSAEDDSYWRLVLAHGLDGNLQSLLDEQVHVLQESLGLLDAAPLQRSAKVAAALVEALSIRTAQLRIDELSCRPTEGRIEIGHFSTRCRFALRFGELRDDKDQALARADTVRQAFNSPFRPFVLASTSIGQEGLDFHVWCHAVMHWNLPSNPVDLEQREGRVHRYKGHAVRKNIARHYGLAALKDGWDRQGDPWQHLFARAEGDRPEGTSHLVPYWIFEIDGGARVERRVPMLPFSREVQHLQQLKRSLALYRLVFGQPRQQDLLAHLSSHMGEAEAEQAAAEWHISLLPPNGNGPYAESAGNDFRTDYPGRLSAGFSSI